MDNEKPNWVVRHFARKSHLQTGPKQIWQRVITAVQDACDSFREATNDPEINVSTQNGHAITVNATFAHRGGEMLRSNMVRIEFNEPSHLITATLNNKSPKKFQIESDEDGCFIKYLGGKVNEDQLSQAALEDALLKRPEQPKYSDRETYRGNEFS